MSKWIRQFHRWTSIAFTLGFLVNAVIAISGTTSESWVYLLAVAPIFLLLLSGLYLFALPHVARLRRSQEGA